MPVTSHFGTVSFHQLYGAPSKSIVVSTPGVCEKKDDRRYGDDFVISVFKIGEIGLAAGKIINL